MVKLSCAALLFDLDGVLVFSRDSVERQWTRWANDYGLDAKAVLAVAHGRPTTETIREFVPRIAHPIDVESELALMEQREIADMDCVHPVPGAAELLSRIPPDRWTVVTSGTRPLAEARLKYVGLPIPSTMVTASDITRGKPDPEPYLKGAAALCVPAKECVVLEDAPSGVRAGNAAGARVIAIPTTYPREEIAMADYVVERLSDLRVTVTNTPGRQNVRLEILLPGAQ